MTFSDKMEMMRNLMVFPALTVMVLLRKNLGYRLLNPLHICGMALLLFVVGALAINTPRHEALQWFAGAVLFLGIGQRVRRMIDAWRGIRLHSYYIGDSMFVSKRMPKFLRRNRRFTRFFDPFVCIIVGVLLLEPCRPLGAWLILSGFALRVLESTVHKRSENRDLDTIDGMIASEVQAETVEEFMDGPDDRRQHQDAAEGIPTGLSSDIQRKIDQNRRKNRRP